MFHRKWNWYANIRPSPPIHPPALRPGYLAAHTQWCVTPVVFGGADIQAVSFPA